MRERPDMLKRYLKAKREVQTASRFCYGEDKGQDFTKFCIGQIEFEHFHQKMVA
jgi:hypothetical protein